MGTITMSVGPQLGESIDNEINGTSFTASQCTTDFGFDVIVTTDTWIEWTTTGNVTITGGVNGETISAGTYSYTGTIQGYIGFSVTQNSQSSSAVIEIKDSDGGTLIDTFTVLRNHTSQEC